MTLNEFADEHPNFKNIFDGWKRGQEEYGLTWLAGYMIAMLDAGKLKPSEHIDLINQLSGVIESKAETSH